MVNFLSNLFVGSVKECLHDAEIISAPHARDGKRLVAAIL